MLVVLFIYGLSLPLTSFLTDCRRFIKFTVFELVVLSLVMFVSWSEPKTVLFIKNRTHPLPPTSRTKTTQITFMKQKIHTEVMLITSETVHDTRRCCRKIRMGTWDKGLGKGICYRLSLTISVV